MENSVVVVPPPRLFERKNLRNKDLLSLIEIIKLSCCYFDRVFIDEDIVNSLVESDLDSDSEIVKVLYPRKSFLTKKSFGKFELSLYQSVYESINIVHANKKFPYQEKWLSDAKHAQVKFGNRFDNGFDLEFDILGRLDKKIREHHLAVFPLIGSLLDSSTNSLNDGTKEALSLESEVINQTVELYSFDLSQIPLHEILKMRRKKCFANLQTKVDSLINKSELSQTDIRKTIQLEMSEELKKARMTKKKYTMKLAWGLAGYLPIVSSLLTSLNIGMDTKKYIDTRSDWVSFFTSLEN